MSNEPVVLNYKPLASTPIHLQAILRVKGIELLAGVDATLTAEQAGMVMKTAPEGTIQVKSGAPVFTNRMPSSAKAAKRKLDDHVSAFAANPAKAIENIATLPKEVLDVLRGKEEQALKHVNDGKVDHLLGEVMIWAKLGGRVALAVAAAARAVATIAG